MDQGKLRRILSSLERQELTLRERQFVEAVEKYLDENGKVTDQQESVLEGIYNEKMWIRKAFRGEAAFQFTGGGEGKGRDNHP
jgi:uncharacterized membrane-anchored protein